MFPVSLVADTVSQPTKVAVSSESKPDAEDDVQMTDLVDPLAGLGVDDESAAGGQVTHTAEVDASKFGGSAQDPVTDKAASVDDDRPERSSTTPGSLPEPNPIDHSVNMSVEPAISEPAPLPKEQTPPPKEPDMDNTTITQAPLTAELELDLLGDDMDEPIKPVRGDFETTEEFDAAIVLYTKDCVERHLRRYIDLYSLTLH